ncbi:Ig-like domain-containing protein [Polaribacter sp. HL-MS24]|uniref:Ig-like domain-containing protein n=1 Tax=Polaribacter sp. HL-MS24 TaxID=3077735 RepID=UPI002934117C|nr:Ig-like domain-containing protein [Polaribacter sp. HL-MS24]WOC39419.1 Ig-like domain-containing protein [Polaribacter sp. HL-MS24]
MADDLSSTTSEDSPVQIMLAGSDADGDQLTYSITQPDNGAAVATGNSVTYTPKANFNGVDYFNYRANDGKTNSAYAKVTVQVSSVEDLPVAADLSIGTKVNTPAEITLSGSDPDGDALFYTVGNVSNGQISLSGSRATYTPNSNFVGNDSFTYQVSDGKSTSQPATVSISISSNTPPVVQSFSLTTKQNTPIEITLIGSDADSDNLTFTITSFNQGVVSQTDDKLTFTPNSTFSGITSLSYTASDGYSTSNTGVITIVVDNPDECYDASLSLVQLPIHALPLSGEQIYQVQLGSINNYSNSILCESGYSDYRQISTTHNIGSSIPFYINHFFKFDFSRTDIWVDWNADGEFQSTELVSSFTGEESVTGTIQIPSNVSLGSKTLRIRRDYRPDPHTPNAVSSTGYNGGETEDYTLVVQSTFSTNSFSISTEEDTPISVELAVTGESSNSLIYSLVKQPEHGAVSITNNIATYNPDPNFFGSDDFSFKASDGDIDSNVSTVSINISSVNDQPTTASILKTVKKLETSSIDLLGSDIDGDNLTYTIVSGPSNGSALLSGSVLTYTSDSGNITSDLLTYKANDGFVDSNVSSISISIIEDNSDSSCGPKLEQINQDALDNYAQDSNNNFLPIPSGLSDRDWAGTTVSATVNEIESNFTAARSLDSSVYQEHKTFEIPQSLKVKVCPDGGSSCLDGDKIEKWFLLSIQEKGLFILNSERAARGLPTFQGVSTEVVDIAQQYADALANRNNGLSHNLSLTINGVQTSTPWERLASNQTISNHSEFYGFAENLAYTANNPQESNIPIEHAIYLWNYNDSSSNWGHRNFNLSILNDNSGNEYEEGLIGFGVKKVVQSDGWIKYYTVMNVIDPDSTWDLTNLLLYCSSAFQNHRPSVFTVSKSTTEDIAVEITLSGTDTDGDELTFSVTDPSNGTVELNGAVVTYIPAANFNGTDSFTYTANDGTLDSEPATVTITVTAVNDSPVVSSAVASTNEDTAVDITLFGTDADEDELTFSVTDPSNGSVVLDGAVVTYTPNANFNGSDSFSYTANDGNIDSESATITITVTAVNDAPIVSDESASTNEDTAVEITLSGTDADEDELTFSVTDPSDGTVELNGAVVAYIPAANFNGTDSFTYTANDVTLDSEPATVTITVTAVNDSPVVSSAVASTNEDTAVDITLSGTDIEEDELTFAVTDPSNGTVVLDGAVVTYTPNADFNSTDSFTYTANDGGSTSEVATVSITVTAVNDTPVVFDEAITTNEDIAVEITLTGTDADEDELTFSVTDPSNGSVVLDGAVVTYTPNANFNGSDSFSYTANDGNIDSESATITITVTAVNDAPIVSDESASTKEDTAVEITLSGTDTDGDELTFSVTDPSNGTVELNGAVVTYIPAANFNGTDSFTYTANDGTLDSEPATVTITVTAVNDSPVVSSAVASTNEDTAVDITLSGTDADEDELTFSVTDPSDGTVELNGAVVAYTPAANFNGTDSFTYTANDGTADSESATITITVNASLSSNEYDVKSFIIFPNPTSSHIRVEIQFKKAKVYDIFGRIVLESSDKIIDLTNLETGVYLLTLYDDSNRILGTSKVTKK